MSSPLRLQTDDDNDERADRFNPLADVSAAPSSTLHDAIKERLTAKVDVPTIRIEIPLRPGVEISYRCNLSPRELMAAEKKGKRAVGDANLSYMMIAMAVAAEDLFIDGEKQCRVGSEEFLAATSQDTVADGIAALYEDQSGYILSAFVQLMIACGYPDPS